MVSTIEKPKSAKVKMSPGVYPGMSMADYVNIDAISAHTLAWMEVSARHFKAAMDGRLAREDTSALSFGRAFHCRLLERDQFESRYAIRTPCRAVLKSGDRKGAACGNPSTFLMPDGTWSCGTHAGEGKRQVEDSVTPEELDRLECCCEAVRETDAVKILRRKGQCEVVLVSEYNGLLIKSRLDKSILDPSLIIDVKKVAAASTPDQARIVDRAFSKSLTAYGYGIQMGVYRWNFQQQYGSAPEFWWLVVEDDEPMSVAIYKADEKTKVACHNRMIGLIDRVVECTKTNNWPGVCNGVVEISAPNWFLKENGQG